jgi:hypothetical protein
MCLKSAVLAGTLAMAGLVADSGFIVVKLREHRADGTRLTVIVPGILVPAAVKLVPARGLNGAPPEFREALPALAVAARELQHIPDGPLVEVVSQNEEVRIAKSGDALSVSVRSPAETVQVRVPLRALAALARDLELRAASLPLSNPPPEARPRD